MSQIDVGHLYTEYTRLCLLNLKAEKKLEEPIFSWRHVTADRASLWEK